MGAQNRRRGEAVKGDNRTTERGHLVFYLRVFDLDDGGIVGHLTDISTDGIMLVSDRAIEAGRTLNVRLILPKEVAGRSEAVFAVKSLWSRADVNPEFHIAGFQFEQIDREQAALINRLNEEFSREHSLTPDNSDRPACNLTHTTGR